MRLQASELQQTFTTRYDVPIRDPARERVSLNFTASDTQVSDNVRTGLVSLTPSITPSATSAAGFTQTAVAQKTATAAAVTASAAGSFRSFQRNRFRGSLIPVP